MGTMSGKWLIVSHRSSEIETTLAPNGWKVDEPPEPDDGDWRYVSIMDDQVRLAIWPSKDRLMFYIAVRSVK